MSNPGTVIRERSPRAPSLTLRKALERAGQFHAEHDRRLVRVESAIDAWGYATKSSGGRQALATLLMYGILQDTGSGNDRKVQLTDVAWRYFVDERPEQREAAIKQMAVAPPILGELWKAWGAKPPGDAECRSQLRIERGFTETAAQELLDIYKDNIVFAGLAKADIVSSENPSGTGIEGNDIFAPHIPTLATGQKPQPVKIMESERVAFTEEGQPGQYLKLIASGEVDDTMLEALEDYVKRQRKRLAIPKGETN